MKADEGERTAKEFKDQLQFKEKGLKI